MGDTSDELSHIDRDGRAHMVDVGQKATTDREAVAVGFIRMSKATLERALSRETKKGDAMGIAELAGIMGAKKTSDLIPLCHPLPLSHVKVEVTDNQTPTALKVTVRVKTNGKTGVEMEALTAVMTTCLTLYDMLKAIDKSMIITDVALERKTGGASGDFHRKTTA